MRLLLIRHGETVDNVAGLYAGVRDSALTIHGVEQARRLGDYLVSLHLQPSHIFASPLQRAYNTAQAIARRADGNAIDVPIVKVDDLIEQDFGFYEGKPFRARSSPRRPIANVSRDLRKEKPDFVDVESKDSMAKRADTFIDWHLLPLLQTTPPDDVTVIAVVSHGMLLSTLWRRLLLRLSEKSLSIAPEVIAKRGDIVLEHLGGWSNTGYLDLLLNRPPLPASTSPVASPAHDASPSPPPLYDWTTTILAIDSKEHLANLKRQRGGIGRIAHDESQRTLDNFFKRQRKA